METKAPFQHALDFLVKHNTEYAYWFMDCGLTLAASRKSIVIPPKSVMDNIKKLKSKDDMKNEIMKYILRKPPQKKSAVEALKSGEGYIYSFVPKHYYTITKKGTKYYLNGVEVKILEEMKDGRTAILKAEKKLIPIEYIDEKSNTLKVKKTTTVAAGKRGKIHKKHRIANRHKKYKINKRKKKSGGKKKKQNINRAIMYL